MFGYCIVVSLTALVLFVIKHLQSIHSVFTHTPHHTKSALGSRGRDTDTVSCRDPWEVQFVTVGCTCAGSTPTAAGLTAAVIRIIRLKSNIKLKSNIGHFARTN